MKHIMNVKPIGDNDRECLSEIRDVLARYGKLDRFGVTLLHNHFPVEADEVLVETEDTRRRRLVSEPEKKSLVRKSSSIETAWRLCLGEEILDCLSVCVTDPKTQTHRKS